MAKGNYKYLGVKFRQRERGCDQLLFVAEAEQIVDWGGVPRKSADFMKGFQRALDDTRASKITEFFEDAENISPTAIVVAFKPERIKILPLDLDHDEIDNSLGEPVLIEVLLDDFEKLSTEELAAKVSAFLKEELNGNGADEDNADDDDDDDEDDSDEDDSDEDVRETLGLSIGASHLKRFVKNLDSSDWLSDRKAENELLLRDTLIDLLKPATIVDGQHRAFGTADAELGIPFSVVALVDTDWKEEVFQFVVINQRAKPIKTEFLSAIISSSLSGKDITQLKSRLEQAGVDLDSTQIMDLVHSHEESPFYQMIDYKVEGAEGKLPYSGMLTSAKRFRSLSTHNPKIKYAAFFKQIFADFCEGRTLQQKKTEWKTKIKWFECFSTFWGIVREQLASGDHADLWEPGTNLLKVVTIQELQNMFLEWLFNQRDSVSTRADVEAAARKFLQYLKPRFFTTKWEATSLQSDTGRDILREALEAALGDASYKYNDRLFRGWERN